MIVTLLFKRAVFFIAFVLVFALVAASMAHSATSERGMVAFSGFRPGTIVVRTSERSLYFVIDEQRAMRFPVGVGKAGKTWTGVAQVEGKYVKPAWQAPDELGGGPVIPGGAANNPMGVAALTLRGGEYAIHGTNRPESIGRFVSSGCIRMHNRDIVELYGLVAVGTPVIVER
jgi:lipoprotein-anchoring transpeptidase ErfK/SrfK